MDVELVLRAGRLAERSGWTDPVLVKPADVDAQGPAGPPMVVVADEELTLGQAQAIAALVGAGRTVRLLCKEPLPAAAETWLPPEVFDDEGATEVDPLPVGAFQQERVSPDTGVGVTEDLVGGAREDAAVTGNPFEDQLKPWRQRALAALYAMDWGPEEEELRVNQAKSMDIPEVLEVLAGSSSSFWRIRDAAAGNPATPSWLCADIAAEHRPEFDWGLARNPSTPPEVLRVLAADDRGDMRSEVAGNPSAPLEVLRVLATDQELTVRRGVAKNPSTPPEVLRALAPDPSRTEREGAAANHATLAEVSAVVWRELATDPKWVGDSSVAADPSTPSVVLEALASRGDDFTRRFVAGNPSTPPEGLRALARDGEANVRGEMAGNPSTPRDVMEALTSDEVWRVRSRVATNVSTPSDVLNALARDEMDDVRAAVARNPSTSRAVLEALAQDEGYGVRAALAANPSIPSEVLQTLAGDDSVEVSMGLASNPATPDDVLASIDDPLVLMALLRSLAYGNVSPGLIRHRYGSTSIREHAPTWDLEWEDNWEEVMELAASNPKAPGWILHKISEYCLSMVEPVGPYWANYHAGPLARVIAHANTDQTTLDTIATVAGSLACRVSDDGPPARA